MARRISDENGPNADPWVSEIKIGETTITAALAAELVALTEAEGGGAASDIAYDATSWNGNTDAPTKNTIRDLVEVTLPASYMKLISTTTVSSPVEFVEIDLPAGFSAFRLVVSSAKAPLGAVFSQDGGATWLEDYATTFAAYLEGELFNTGGFADGTEQENAGIGFERLSANSTISIDAVIYPGSATRKAALIASYGGEPAALANVRVVLLNSVCQINTARVDAIQFCVGVDGIPGGAGDITYGTFSLYGVL